jgi:hypothetical protein
MAASARAHGAPAPDDYVGFAEHPLAIGVVFGIATPTGEVGTVVEYSVSHRFAAGVGAGYNFVGLQLAASGRLRLALYEGQGAAHAFAVVAAVATGRYQGGLHFRADDGYWDERAYWLQAGLDYEVLRWSHLRFATGIGFAKLIGSSDAKQVCVDYCPRSPLEVWPTTHVTLGGAF